MAASSLMRGRDECGVEEDRRRLVPRSSRARDVTSQVGSCRERHGRDPDRQADRRGLAHVVARHP